MLANRVAQTSTAVGNAAAFNLTGGAKTGHRTFGAGVGYATTTYYAIVHQSSGEWEVGIGTVTAGAPDVLNRTTVLDGSSGAGNRVDFSAGTKDIFVTLPASKVVYKDNNDVVQGTVTFANGIAVQAGTSSFQALAATSGMFTATVTVDATTGTGAIELKGGSGGGTNVAQLSFSRSGASELARIETVRDGANDAGALVFYTRVSAGPLVERARITSTGVASFAAGVVTGDSLAVGGAGILTFTGHASPAASTGIIRLPNDQAIYARNAGNTGNIGMIYVSAGDQLVIGQPAGSSLNVQNTVVFFPSIGTTASAANTFLDSGSSNSLLRSTSSARYKRDIRALSTNEALRIVRRAQPVWYRSKAAADDKRRRHLGLIAEREAQNECALVHYSDGRPESVQYDRYVAPLLKAVAHLESRLTKAERRLRRAA